MIGLGDKIVSALYIGNNAVSAIYKGSDLVWKPNTGSEGILWSGEIPWSGSEVWNY